MLVGPIPEWIRRKANRINEQLRSGQIQPHEVQFTGRLAGWAVHDFYGEVELATPIQLTKSPEIWDQVIASGYDYNGIHVGLVDSDDSLEESSNPSDFEYGNNGNYPSAAEHETAKAAWEAKAKKRTQEVLAKPKVIIPLEQPIEKTADHTLLSTSSSDPVQQQPASSSSGDIPSLQQQPGLSASAPPKAVGGGASPHQAVQLPPDPPTPPSNDCEEDPGATPVGPKPEDTVAITLRLKPENETWPGHLSDLSLDNVEACSTLLAADFVIWICVYIDQDDPEGDSRRLLAQTTRRDLAIRLGLGSDEVDKPTAGYLFMQICDANVWQFGGDSFYGADSPQAKRIRDLNFNGKADAILHYNTRVMIDEDDDVCAECAAYGIVAYRVFSKAQRQQRKGLGKGRYGKGKQYPFRIKVLHDKGIEHPEQLSLLYCARVILDEKLTGILHQKHVIVRANQCNFRRRERLRRWGQE